MATAYHRDQPGAPTYAFGTSGAAGFAAFKTIAKACLVTGYAGLAAAGWELVAEATNYLVLRTGNHSGYVCFTWPPSANYMTVYLAETYEGISSNVMIGQGLKSGIASANSAQQRVYLAQAVYASTTSSWVLVADEKSFVLNMVGYANSSALTVDTYSLILYAGEDSAGGLISIGGVNSPSDTNPIPYFDGGNGFTSLRNPATGLLVDSGSLLGVRTPGLDTLNRSTASSAISLLPEISLCPAYWSTSGTVSGRLRGIALSPLLLKTWDNHAARSLGAAADLTARTMNTSLDLGGGNSYFITVKANNSSFFLMTDAERFWS